MPSVKRKSASSVRKPMRAPGPMNVKMKKRPVSKSARGKRKAERGFWTFRKAVVLFSLFMFTTLVAAGYWFVSSGKLQRLQDYMIHSSVQYLKDKGFAIQHVIVDGRTRTLKSDLLKALHVEKGDFVYDIDLEKKLTSIEALPWVQSARIERRLPGTLYVKLVERHPIGFWQHQRKHFLVDTAGSIVSDFPLKAFPGFVVSTGEGAPEHLPALIQSLGQYDTVYAKVTGAVFIGKRRWDLILNNRLTIQLPEEHVDQALQRVAELERENRLLSGKIDTVDLRHPGKVYFYLSKKGKEKRRNRNNQIT